MAEQSFGASLPDYLRRLNAASIWRENQHVIDTSLVPFARG